MPVIAQNYGEKMKKLLFINGHLNTGGVEKSLLDILQHIDYSQYHVDLLLLEGRGDYFDQLPSEVSVIFKDLHHTYGGLLQSMRTCIRTRDNMCLRMRLLFAAKKLTGNHALKNAAKILLGSHEYDVGIGFRPGICSDLVAYSVNAKKKFTWWHHGGMNVDPTKYSEMCGEMDKVAVVSESCKTMLENTCPMIRDKLVCIPNMLDAANIIAKSKLQNPYCKTDKRILVSVGRLSDEKHFENAVIAASRLRKAGITDFEWHIVGNGSDREKIWQAIREYHIEDVVMMDGSQMNPYPYMKQADLYVHPSYVESQGLTILEAMALGTPCVVTKSLGPCEFIRDGENGLLVDQSPDALAEGILRMLNDHELYNHIKKNTHCPDQFSPECVMKKIYNVIEDTI